MILLLPTCGSWPGHSQMKKDKKGFFEKLNYFILFCYYYDGLLEVRNFVQIHIKLVNKFEMSLQRCSANIAAVEQVPDTTLNFLVTRFQFDYWILTIRCPNFCNLLHHYATAGRAPYNQINSKCRWPNQDKWRQKWWPYSEYYYIVHSWIKLTFFIRFNHECF